MSSDESAKGPRYNFLFGADMAAGGSRDAIERIPTQEERMRLFNTIGDIMLRRPAAITAARLADDESLVRLATFALHGLATVMLDIEHEMIEDVMFGEYRTHDNA